MSPLRARTGPPSGNKFRITPARFETGKIGRVAGLSAAAVMVLGVGTASALFVDYLADRALDRKTAAIEVTPLVTAAVDSVAEVASPIAEAHAAPMIEEPALPAAVEASAVAVEPEPMKPMPIEAVLPDAAAIAKVAVEPGEATELAASEPADDSLVSAYSEEEDTSATTAAISPAEDEPEPAAKPRKAKSAPAEPQAKSGDSTEIASLPGVDVGGMAGYPSEDGDQSGTVSTATKSQPRAASAGGIASGTAKVRQAVNMRSGPKKGAGVVGVVPAGSSVNVMSCDGWCQISFNGRTGWVYKSFLSAGAPKKQAASDDEPKKTTKTGQSSRL